MNTDRESLKTDSGDLGVHIPAPGQDHPGPLSKKEVTFSHPNWWKGGWGDRKNWLDASDAGPRHWQGTACAGQILKDVLLLPESRSKVASTENSEKKGDFESFGKDKHSLINVGWECQGDENLHGGSWQREFDNWLRTYSKRGTI